MKVSIITVTFNSEKFLAACMDSVIRQTYKDVEFIIIDGASKDNTLSIIKSYGNKVSKFVSEKDHGIYDAMNKGLKFATGEIIGILNSDDLYNNELVLERVVEVFSKTNCQAVYGDLLYVKQDNINAVTRKWISGTYKRSAFLYGWMPPHPAFFVRKDIYETFGTFNTTLRSAADYEIMLRFLYKHRITVAYIPEIIVRMREGGISNANLKNRYRANREDRKAWKLNELRPYFFTLLLKPLRKIPQLFSGVKA